MMDANDCRVYVRLFALLFSRRRAGGGVGVGVRAGGGAARSPLEGWRGRSLFKDTKNE